MSRKKPRPELPPPSTRRGRQGPQQVERTELLASLDEAEREIDEGRSYTADELRHAVRSWTGE
jgi:hypothetical protein